MTRHQRAEAHAPAPHELVRLPQTSADDYACAPARQCRAAWDYEHAVDVADTDWAAVAGRRRGNEQRAAVLRPARVLALPPVLAFAPLDHTDVLAWGVEPDDTALADAYSDGYRDGVAVATADARRAA